jgi:hypothetical protein
MPLKSVSAFIVLLAMPVVAQLGNGGNGDLETTPMAINANFMLTVSGGAGQPFGIYVSDGPGPVVIPGFGSVSLDLFSPAFGLLWEGLIGPGGTSSLSVFIPNDPGILSLVVYAQGGVVDPGHPSGVALTRGIRIDFATADSFESLPDLSGPRALGTGDLLKDGRVLIAGGGNGTLLAPVATTTTEIFEPFSRTWSAGPNLSAQRSLHASAVLNDGRVLLCGGTSTAGSVTATCEIFNPATNAFTQAAPMGSARAGHAATTLNDGRVLVTGGTTTFTGTSFPPILNGALTTGEVYDPITNVWTPVSNVMAAKRLFHTQTRLQDGRVLCVSGISGAQNVILIGDVPTFTATCNIYNPATNSFGAAASIPTARAGHRATLMPNGEVFVSGGVYSSLFIPTATNDARKYVAATNTWTSAGVLPASVALQGQVLLKNGQCHVSGGGTGTLLAFQATNACGIRAGGAATVTTTNSMPDARGFHIAVRLHDGSVLISGGGDTTAAAVATNLLYTPVP